MGLARMSDRLRLIGRHKAMEADDRAINASTTLRAQLIFSMISDLCPKTAGTASMR